MVALRGDGATRSMMNRPLVLFTTNHPFTHTGGETMFVGPELSALVALFPHVQVVPLYDTGFELPMPAGCSVDRTLAASWRRRGLYWVARATAWPGFVPELWRGWRTGGWVGAARVWRWAAVAAATRDWMRKALTGSAPPLLYTYWRGGQTLAAARWRTAHIGTLAVSRVHRYELYDDAFYPPFQPWTSVYDSLDLVIAIARQGADYLRARNVTRTLVARLGVACATKRAQASSDGVWRLVSCSTLTAVKRVDRCAMLVLELARRHPERQVEWIHFGAGPTRAAVEANLRDAPANIRARLAGLVSNDMVLAHYRSHPVDAFVLLSESEGLPVSIQEAFAHGIPVVATDVGGVCEAVDAGGDNGALIRPDAPIPEIAEALERLLLAPEAEREARREAAWRRWAIDFDARSNHAQLAAALAALDPER
jgi:colanic acid/amylovoran biosynthesis glycosyltransferase